MKDDMGSWNGGVFGVAKKVLHWNDFLEKKFTNILSLYIYIYRLAGYVHEINWFR